MNGLFDGEIPQTTGVCKALCAHLATCHRALAKCEEELTSITSDSFTTRHHFDLLALRVKLKKTEQELEHSLQEALIGVTSRLSRQR
jgi:hypothetical protein